MTAPPAAQQEPTIGDCLSALKTRHWMDEQRRRLIYVSIVADRKPDDLFAIPIDPATAEPQDAAVAAAFTQVYDWLADTDPATVPAHQHEPTIGDLLTVLPSGTTPHEGHMVALAALVTTLPVADIHQLPIGAWEVLRDSVVPFAYSTAALSGWPSRLLGATWRQSSKRSS